MYNQYVIDVVRMLYLDESLRCIHSDTSLFLIVFCLSHMINLVMFSKVSGKGLQRYIEFMTDIAIRSVLPISSVGVFQF